MWYIVVALLLGYLLIVLKEYDKYKKEKTQKEQLEELKKIKEELKNKE